METNLKVNGGNYSDDSFRIVLKEDKMQYFESNFFLVYYNMNSEGFDTFNLVNNRGEAFLVVPPNRLDSTTVSTMFFRGETINQIDSNYILIAKSAQLFLKRDNQNLRIEKSKDYSITHDNDRKYLKE